MRRRDRLHRPSVEKAFLRRVPRIELARFGAARRLSMRQSARPVSAKEIHQTELYLGENFPGRADDASWSDFDTCLKAGFEFGEVGRFTKFSPGSRAKAERDRVRLPDLPRQRFKLVRDSHRLFQAPKIE